MKYTIKILLILIVAMLIFFSGKAQKQPKTAYLKITYVHREGQDAEVWGKSSYRLFKANCKNLPDSVKLGTVLKVQAYKGQNDCICVFKRVY